MTPDLPSNPLTITPPVRMARTAQGAWDFFAGRIHDDRFFTEVRIELQNLKDWDNYERQTAPEREKAKLLLRYFLDRQI